MDIKVLGAVSSSYPTLAAEELRCNSANLVLERDTSNTRMSSRMVDPQMSLTDPCNSRMNRVRT
jgi:hypothetical protein